MKKMLTALIVLAASGAAMADVQLEIRDFRGASIASSNGQKARFEDANTPGYVIIDFTSGQMLMVDPARNEAMAASVQGQPADGGGGGIEVSLKDKGGGQKIAGYSTRKYVFRAAGRKCGTVYASKKLFNNRDVRALFESMRSMQRASRSMMGSMGGMMSECQRANLQLADSMESVGAPMKILDENGRVISEITRVHIGKSLPAGHYELPAGTRVVDMQEMSNRALQQSQQAMEQMPEMNQLMQQIQQSGGQVDEDLQQQIQQMIQQMQKQQQQ